MPTIAEFPSVLVLAAVLTVWTGLELVLGLRTSGATLMRAARGPELMIAVLTVAALLVAIVASGAIPAGMIRPPRLAFIIGIALLTAGVGVRGIAAATLGALYTLNLGTQAGQRICDRGLYRWVRHPGYLGTLVGLLGFAIALGNWFAVPAIALVVPGLWVRIRSEERILHDAFGQAYVDYCASTRWRLIPGVI